jgi:hypothetical protein
MKNWKAIVGVIAIFILGGLAGSITTIGLVRHRLAHGHGSQMLQDLIVRRLSWDLRLDRDQREQLRVIVAQGHEDMKVIRKQIQPQVEDLLTRSEVKVRVILRPDQQEKFDKLIAERKAQWAESNGG